jgi:hypothetical protein
MNFPLGVISGKSLQRLTLNRCLDRALFPPEQILTLNTGTEKNYTRPITSYRRKVLVRIRASGPPAGTGFPRDIYWVQLRNLQDKFSPGAMAYEACEAAWGKAQQVLHQNRQLHPPYLALPQSFDPRLKLETLERQGWKLVPSLSGWLIEY